MLRSICYKEWLKIGKVSLLLFIVGLLVIAGLYLTVRHELVLKDSERIWDGIVNQRQIYFTIFKFFPLIAGLLIGVAQYIPETMEKRIKLSLHLPMNEEEVVVKMVAFGAVVVTGMFLILFLLFYGWGIIYFPYQVLKLASLTVFPWFLSGLAAYFLSGFVILEPIWKYRIAYMLSGGAFITLFYKSNIAGAYQPSLPVLFLCVLLISISPLFSIYRFRKGEM